MIALGGGFLDGSIHAFDLPVGPRMMWFGQAVLDSMSSADEVEGASAKQRRRTSAISRQIGKLDAVIGEHGVDLVRNYSRKPAFCTDKTAWPPSWGGSHDAAPVPSDSLDSAVSLDGSPLLSWCLGAIPGT